jgi:transcriptional regulator GlxA family with amidase domain
MIKKIAIFVADDCFGSNVYGIIDAFGCANGAVKDLGLDLEFKVEIVSKDGLPVSTINGHALPVERSIEAVTDTDAVITLLSLPKEPTAADISRKMAPLSGVMQWLKDQTAAGTIIASNCTGSFLLAEAGLLDGKRATTHWMWASAFRNRYPDVSLEERNMVIDNGQIICGGGAGAYVDLALQIIRRFGGEELAVQCAHSLVVDPARNLQAPYALTSFKTGHQDDLVDNVQRYIADNLAQELNVQELADAFFVSPRTLMRRFKAATGLPVATYIQGLRIDAARSRLATSRMSLQSIIGDVGYEDFSSFTRLFKLKTGLTMQTYRDRFQPAESLLSH